MGSYAAEKDSTRVKYTTGARLELWEKTESVCVVAEAISKWLRKVTAAGQAVPDRPSELICLPPNLSDLILSLCYKHGTTPIGTFAP